MNLDALAFGAHADDVELGCSGTLIKLGASGRTTGVIALTRGEMGTRGDAATRAKEFDDAAAIMGLTAWRMLDLPDGWLEEDRPSVLKIVAVVREFRPRIVFAPYWVSRHPDHECASRLVRRAAFLAGLKKLETGQEPFRPFKIIYYAGGQETSPSFIVDISDFQERKRQAILAYRSQFFNPAAAETGAPETLIARPEFLERIEARGKHYGARIGAAYGEPFWVREAIRVDDPVDFFGPEYLNAHS